MKVYEGIDVRNVALVGHGHAGKTSLAAGLLYTSGGTNRLTRVDEGNTITDFDEEEVSRKVTVSIAVAYSEWAGKKINLLDTPGFNIFIQDAKAAMAAADSALIVVDGVAGVVMPRSAPTTRPPSRGLGGWSGRSTEKDTCQRPR